MARVSLILGNQNQKIEAGVSAIGSLTYGDAAMEMGLSLNAGQLFKAHTIKQSGSYYGYDFFSLVGIGKNGNLLGSSLSDLNPVLIFNDDGSEGFSGLGFGFQKEFLPKELSHFDVRRGKLLMRFSKAKHSFDITFMNDFRFGRLFNGEGTDFGSTGTLRLGYTEILSIHDIYRAGIAIELFTPKPDYSKTPDNRVNSDDGRKNVWYMEESFSKVFYANLYTFGSYQNEYYSVFTKIGVNSQKLGAFVQNTLHDGPGLNPRFPWDITAKYKLLYELKTSLLKTEEYED
ncbi:hypothetical protein GCM10022393_15520 [Aquimarina addita]|uniref:Bacterial toxin 23 domain-containing protein n=1 Tax=Aquimarina addita TaxID=870485 RepID=A0ABP7XGZ8_9FLAO